MHLSLSLFLLVLYGLRSTYSVSSPNTPHWKYAAGDNANGRSGLILSNMTTGSLNLVREDAFNKTPLTHLSPRADFDIHNDALEPGRTWGIVIRKGRRSWRILQEALSQSTLPNQRGINIDDKWETRHIAPEVFRPAVYLCKPGEILSLIDQTDNSRLPHGEKICGSQYEYIRLGSKEPVRLSDGSVRWFSTMNGISPDAHSIITFNPVNAINAGSNGFWKQPPNSWADIVFALWQQQCENEHKPMSRLKYITRADERSDQTVLIMNVIAENPRNIWQLPGGVVSRANTQNLIVKPETDAFFALLGTPALYGVAKMLSDHVESFETKSGQTRGKVKTIQDIRIKFNPAGIPDHITRDIVVVLRDISPPPPPPPPPQLGSGPQSNLTNSSLVHQR